MKVFVGLLATAGVLFTTAAANAQVLVPYRGGVGAAVTVSDFGGPGPYAAMPPEMAGPGYAPPLLPPREIFAIARESGFAPLGALQQRGFVYTMAAIDEGGEDGRLVIDARNGRILRFLPAYRMGSRMNDELSGSYGPEGVYRSREAPPFVRDERHPPRPAVGLVNPNNVLPKVASRTPAVPLPKAAPRAVATPAKAVTSPPAVAVAPPAAPAAPAAQQAAVEPKPDAVRVIPLDAAAAKPEAAAAPSVAKAPVEAKPSTPEQPAGAMPPVQGLE